MCVGVGVGVIGCGSVCLWYGCVWVRGGGAGCYGSMCGCVWVVRPWVGDSNVWVCVGPCVGVCAGGWVGVMCVLVSRSARQQPLGMPDGQGFVGWSTVGRPGPSHMDCSMPAAPVPTGQEPEHSS